MAVNQEGPGTGTIEAVEIPIGPISLKGDLAVPAGAAGIVAFAHGSGSSRLSPRNRYVAGEFQAVKLGTLLFDLLTPEEERIDAQTAQLRFDIGLLPRGCARRSPSVASTGSEKRC